MATIPPRPKSQQVAEQILQQIRHGRWQVGSRLPSVRQLAQQFDVSINTAQGALKQLEAEQVIECRPRRRGLVSKLPDHAPARARRRTTLNLLMIGALAPKQRPANQDSWMERIVLAAERQLFEQRTCSLTRICSMHGDAEPYIQETTDLIHELGPQASGAILFTVRNDSRHQILNALDSHDLPWVTINRPTDRVLHNYVSCHNRSAGRIAGRCFAEHNCSHIVILGSPLKGALGMLEKVLGVYQAFLEANLSVEQIRCLTAPGYDQATGYQLMQDYLSHSPPPQGVFATGDRLALGAMQALRQQGLSIPHDVSVLGSTGLNDCPGLSVVTQPMEAMGQAAADMLLHMIDTNQRQVSCQEIPGVFIDRGSVVLTDSLREYIRQEHTAIQCPAESQLIEV